MNRRLCSLALALSLTAGLCLPAGATLGESGGFDYEPTPAPEGRTARAALFSAGAETEAITVKLGNNNPDLITGFTVAAAPAGGGEALYGVRQGEGWDYKIPFSVPPQEDTDFTITVTSQSSAPGFHAAGVKETVMTYNAIKSLTIKSGDTDATGKTLYLQTNNAQGRQSVQLAATKNGSSGSTGPTGYPYMKANGYAEQVLWTSSNEAVASVDATGLVTAHTGGTATVTASVYGGKVKATCTVNVSAVTGVSLSHTAYTLFTGGTAAETQFTLTAALTGGVSSDELEWTNSNPGAAAMTVAADGRSATIDASGKTAGSTTITAHIKGAPDTARYKASCIVTVVTIVSVSVSPNSYTLYTQGSPQTVQLSATVTPSAAPVWSSSNPAAATVNQTGLVTAVAPGSTTVTATVGGRSGSSTITVKDKIPVASVTVSGTNSLVRTSDNLSPTTQLSASVEPENATLKTVTWVKTGGSAGINISTSGLVTATAAGTATFTATADGVTSTPYTVTVTDQKVTGITIRANDSVLTGKSVSVSATVTPENAINTDITWSLTQSKNYASLSGQTLNGLESGDVFGTVTLRAASNDGGASQTKTVRVTAANGSQVQWAGKSWRVADEDATQFGGKTGSVVLIGDIYETVEFGSNTYYYSTVRNRCLALYNSLTAAQKAKISNHAVVGDPVWVPNSYEIYGSSTPSWGLTPGDTLIRQLGYFANTGTTVSNTEPVRGIYQSYGSWLRVNYNNSGDSICRVLNGYLGYDKSTTSKNAIHPALILNP